MLNKWLKSDLISESTVPGWSVETDVLPVVFLNLLYFFGDYRYAEHQVIDCKMDILVNYT